MSSAHPHSRGGFRILQRNVRYQRALNAELDHRVKNVLATVSAIITQTPKADNSLADFVTGFGNRIRSLAETHELLSHNRWHGVSLEEIVQCELKPYATGNAAIGGPRVTLRAEAAQAVAMVLHELATNAGKYGALADLKGRVDIVWACDEGEFSISWTESNGPPVIPPERRGFGSTVTTSVAEMSVDGAVDLQFPQPGLTWRLTCPADKALELGALTKATSQGRADGATRA